MTTKKDIEAISTKWGLPLKDVLEAESTAQKKISDNYLIISFKYYNYVLPILGGIELLKHLANVEIISDAIAYDYKKITPIDKDHEITATLLSKDDYVEMKMRHILKLTKKPDYIPI